MRDMKNTALSLLISNENKKLYFLSLHSTDCHFNTIFN